LKFGHDVSRLIGCDVEEWRFRPLTPWSKLHILKNLFREVNGSNADPGHCNSNAGYLCSTTAAVTA
jgi:hypothetical protein